MCNNLHLDPILWQTLKTTTFQKLATLFPATLCSLSHIKVKLMMKNGSTAHLEDIHWGDRSRDPEKSVHIFLNLRLLEKSLRPKITRLIAAKMKPMHSGGRGDECEASDTFLGDCEAFYPGHENWNRVDDWRQQRCVLCLRMQDVHCCLNSNIWMSACLLWITQTPELSHYLDQKQEETKAARFDIIT